MDRVLGLAALDRGRCVRVGRDERRAPAPEIVVGQLGAAPPAVNRIVPAEILLAGQNRFAERGQRQPTRLVTIEALEAVVQFEREWPLSKWCGNKSNGCR